MDESRSIEMDAEELAAFLEPGGTGVLTFSTELDEPPYSIPVSYGYDETGRQFFFRLAFPDDTAKDEVIDHPATFVTHRETDDGWGSAVATGRLEEVTETDDVTGVLEGMWSVEIPLVDIFEYPTAEVMYRYFRLAPDELSGRQESPTTT